MNQLTLIDKAFLLKQTSLFSMLDLDLLLIISDKLGLTEFDEGDLVFATGEAAIRMYFIVKGEIEIQSQDKQVLGTLRAPDFFGDESLFSDQSRGYNAICKTDVMLLTISKTNLLTIISECPQVAVGLLQAYTSFNKFRPRKEITE